MVQQKCVRLAIEFTDIDGKGRYTWMKNNFGREREGERNLLNRGESVAVKEFQLEYYPLGNQNGRRFTGWSVSMKNDEHLDLCLITVRCPSVPIFP